MRMTRFIPKDKLSKKARRELDAKQRRTWPVSPVSRTFADRKKYNRKRETHDCRHDWQPWDFLF